jgi:hypothetical protein
MEQVVKIFVATGGFLHVLFNGSWWIWRKAMGKNKTVKHDRRPDVAPNILIVLVHDAGPTLPNTFSGEVLARTVVAS